MTDKEMAEEYVDTLLDKDDAELDKFLNERNLFQERCEDIEFNYYCDKVDCQFLSRNEWHYVKDGDLPKEEGAVLIYWKFGNVKCASVVEPYKITEDTHIIAWKEIVLPKEIENA